jgi:hypothetical protein
VVKIGKLKYLMFFYEKILKTFQKNILNFREIISLFPEITILKLYIYETFTYRTYRYSGKKS